MDILSDYSNLENTNDFKSYYTGYFLENDRKIVIAKTWYAEEMERPGCVWTQSLIINFDDLIYCANSTTQLLSLFNRPDANNNKAKYGEVLKLSFNTSNNDDLDNKKFQYMIWIILGQKSPICVVSKNSEEYIIETLYVWLSCYSELKEGYSFITGVSSINSKNIEDINLQFCSNKTFNKYIKIPLIKSINEVEKFPVWVESASNWIINDKWQTFLKFKYLFNDLIDDSLDITMFIKLFSCFYVKDGFIDIYDSLYLIDKIFGDSKSNIGNRLLSLYFQGEFDELGKYNMLSNIVIASLNFSWIHIPPPIFEKLIEESLETDIINTKKIVSYLVNLEQPLIKEKYLSLYAHLLTSKNFESFTNMEYNICNELISINPILAMNYEVWKQSLSFQQGILETLKVSSLDITKTTDMIKIILSTSKFDFSNEIYFIWREKSILNFINCLLGIDYLNCNETTVMSKICKNHSQNVIQFLEEKYKYLLKEQILFLFTMIDPYLDTISYKNFEQIYMSISVNTLNDEQKNLVADTYLPYILRSGYKFSDSIVNFSVTNVYERLESSTYPNINWQKLKRILPEASLFNQWDKCKQLRKAVKKKGLKVKKIDEINDFDIELF